MKRRWLAMLIAAIMLMPVWAMAYSATMTTNATLYDHAPGESPDDEDWLVKGSISAGTVVNVTGTESGKYHVTYAGGEGYVNGGTFEKDSTDTATDDGTDGSTDTGTSTSTGSTTKTTVRKVVAPTWTVYYGDSLVTLTEAGTYECVIKEGGTTYRVRTSSLDWGSEADADQLLAIVNKKSSVTTIPLLKDKLADAEVITHIPAWAILLVEKVGQKYTRIQYNGYTGFVKTMYLNFCPITEEAQTAQLQYNGKTSGKTSINVRAGRGKKFRKIGEFPTGTEVAVINYGANWSMIDVGGYRGYVDNDFLQLEP